MPQSKIETAPLPVSGNTRKSDGERKSGVLATAGIAGVLASACCIGPLVLVSIGLGSIAAGVVAMFEPLRPIFIVIALAALAFAGWKIYRRPAAACEPGAACAAPETERMYKAVFWTVAAIVLALIAFPYYITLFF